MIDLSARIIQPHIHSNPPPAAPRPAPRRLHPLRRALQVLCGAGLVLLPLTDGLRLDVRAGTFYFAWHRMAAHDLMLLFWAAMLAVWALVAVSFLYGRVWCGWVCPQTLASDFADSLKARLDKRLRARQGRGRLLASRGLWAGIVVAMAAGTGLTVAAYWLAPHTVGRAFLHPLSDLGAAAVVYGIAAVVAADMLWVRRKFCARACPYGAMLGVLADQNTLAVRFLDERAGECISCGRCETVCPMGIDIKQGAAQLECIGCGECVDACEDVLGKRGGTGIIEFRYGLAPERVPAALSRAQRWGVWDSKRSAVLGGAVLFAILAAWQVYGQAATTATVVSNGAISSNASGAHNAYALTVVNGSVHRQRYAVEVGGLPPGTAVAPATLTLAAREVRTAAIVITVPRGVARAGHRLRGVLRVRGGGSAADVPIIFYVAG